MAEQYVFDGRRVVFVQRIFPVKMMSGDNREYHRIMREGTVRILLEDGEALEVPHSALTPASYTVSETNMAKWLEDAKASWAMKRGELNLRGLIDRQTGERLNVIDVAFAKWANERAEGLFADQALFLEGLDHVPL